jgi:hypothetical protein
VKWEIYAYVVRYMQIIFVLIIFLSAIDRNQDQRVAKIAVNAFGNVSSYSKTVECAYFCPCSFLKKRHIGYLFVSVPPPPPIASTEDIQEGGILLSATQNVYHFINFY